MTEKMIQTANQLKYREKKEWKRAARNQSHLNEKRKKEQIDCWLCVTILKPRQICKCEKESSSKRNKNGNKVEKKQKNWMSTYVPNNSLR